jgi:hypothetical protein
MISAFRHPYADDAYSIFTAVQIKQKVIDASRGVFKFRDFLIMMGCGGVWLMSVCVSVFYTWV